jgi:hypothetical protein
MRSVLLVIDREDPIRQCANRGLMLARYLHARLDILLCDTDRVYVRRTTQAAAQVRSEAQQFLDALRRSIQGSDLEITTDATFDESVPELVAKKTHQEQSLLVVKCFASRSRVVKEAVDWPLVCSCPAPLLLTHGRPWHPSARFAAAVHAAEQPYADAVTMMVTTTKSLATACSAEFELLYTDPAASLLHMATERDFDLVAFSVADADTTSSELKRLPELVANARRCDLLFVKASVRMHSQYHASIGRQCW